MTEDGRGYRLLTLGRLALVRPGEEDTAVLADAKPLAVLAILAHEGPQRPEQVIELLWPDASRDRAAASLRQALYTLSQAAGEPLVQRTDGLLSLDPAALSADLLDFRTAIQEADYERAIEVHGGHFLGGYETVQDRRFIQWAEGVNDWVEAQLQQAFDHAVEAALRREDIGRAVRLAEAFRARFPLVTQAVDCLVIALRAAGRLRAALAEIRLFEQRLRQDLDEPLPGELADFRAVLEAELHEGLNEVGDEVAEAGVVETETATAISGNGPVDPDAVAANRAWITTGVTLGAVAIVGVLVVAIAGGLDQPELVLPGQTEAGAVRVVLNSEGPRIVQLTEDGRFRIPSSRGMIARNVRSATGVDVELELANGERRRILTEPADEVPLGWSPDGRYLLYRHVTAVDRVPGYEVKLGVWDADRGRPRILYGRPGTLLGQVVTWCPGASQIALVEGAYDGGDVVVVDLNGNVLSRIDGDGLRLSDPAWSPDGERLAFVGKREGEADIFFARRDGSDLRRLGATRSSERTPVWLSDQHVAAVTDAPNPRLVILSVQGGEALSVPLERPVRLAAPLMLQWPDNAADQVSRLVRILEERQDAALPAVWLANLAVGGSDVLSPGEYANYRLTGQDPQGRTSGLLPPAVKWGATDTTILRSLGEGQFRALRTGTTHVHATLPGWGGDSLAVTVQEPPVLHAPVAFIEDWSGGIRHDRWVPYGDPSPVVVPGAGPDGAAAFDNRGDENHNSGAISRRSFSLVNGLTVEAWVRLVPSDHAYHELLVHLSQGEAVAQDVDGTPAATEIAGFNLSGEHRTAALWRRKLSVPLPPQRTDWLLYAFQVQSDSTSALLIDGNVYLRDPEPIPLDEPVHIEIGGRSLGGTALIGSVTVYEGVRYDID